MGATHPATCSAYDGTNTGSSGRPTRTGVRRDALHAFAEEEEEEEEEAVVKAPRRGSIHRDARVVRTDAGVHALDNTMHVDLPPRVSSEPTKALLPHEPHVVASALNHFLKKRGARCGGDA